MNLLKSKRRKQAKKTSEESKRRKQAKKTKTSDNVAKIYEYLLKHGEAKTKDIAAYIGLSAPRTRMILSEMNDIEIVGANTNRKYKIKTK